MASYPSSDVGMGSTHTMVAIPSEASRARSGLMARSARTVVPNRMAIVASESPCSEEGSYLRLTDFVSPNSRLESNKEEEEEPPWESVHGL